MSGVNKRLFILLMLALLVFIFPNLATAKGSISLIAEPKGQLAADGSIVAWSACVSGDWDVYYLNRITGEQKQLTNDPATQSHPSVWQNYIVYQDNRNNLDTGYFDIYLYNLNTGIETLISNLEGDHQEPVIYNNKVVWIDRKDGNNDVVLYDMKTGIAKRISSEKAQAFGLTFDGQIAAWSDFRNGNLDIYCYVIDYGLEQQITRGFEDDISPLVSNGKIVWAVEYNTFRQVYMYDVNTKLKTRLTVGQENHYPLAFNGKELLIREDSHLALNSVDIITEQAVKPVISISPKQAFLIGDQVVWFDGIGITSEPLQTAVARGQQTGSTLKPAPTPSYSSGSVYVPTPVKEEKNVKTSQDTILVSPDGRMSLKILKGSFAQDLNITLHQFAPLNRTGFTSLSPVYEWRIEGGQTAKYPMELSINYKELAAEDQAEKVCIFAFNQGNKYKALLSHRDKDTKVLTTKVTNSGKGALLIYERQFSDLDNHWANHVVSVITSHQIINGYQDGTFKPDRPMTRAEFVTVLVNAMGGPDEGYNTQKFTDVNSKFWAAKYINTASQKRWVSGYGNYFNPNEPITREQMIAIFMRVYEDIEPDDFKAIPPRNLDSFSDNGQVSEWAIEAISKAVECGMVQGFDNELAPKKNATRAEAATILYKFLDKLGIL